MRRSFRNSLLVTVVAFIDLSVTRVVFSATSDLMIQVLVVILVVSWSVGFYYAWRNSKDAECIVYLNSQGFHVFRTRSIWFAYFPDRNKEDHVGIDNVISLLRSGRIIYSFDIERLCDRVSQVRDEVFENA